MPTYDVKCKRCNEEGSIFSSISNKDKVIENTKCDKCGGKLEQIVSAPTFILQGEGWAKDNYK